jgi:PAS domain S-box-containing protein
MSRRKSAEDRLRDLYASLEQTVEERTEQLQQAKQALELKIQESEQVKQRLQSIFESAPNGMIVVDQTGTISQANSTAHSIFRYSIGELTSRRIEALVPQQLRTQHQENRNDYARAPGKRMMGDRKDLYGLRADGSPVPVEVGLNPVVGSETGEVVASVIDITLRKDYEKRIEQRTHALERSNKELKEFAFIASHDLREPLRKIVSFSRLLLSDDYGKMTDEGRTFSLYVVNAAERMRELLDSLLSYSRVTSQARVFVETDLNDTLQVVLSDLQLTIEESQADVDVGELVALTVDPSQIRQLFQNLLSNSLKYQSPDRKPRIRIVGEDINADWYRITLEDNGIGFEPVYSEQVFEVFKRLHSRSDYAGTGMGLAICRKIAERHQGTIRAEGEPGRGTRFIVELPRRAIEEASYDA